MVICLTRNLGYKANNYLTNGVDPQYLTNRGFPVALTVRDMSPGWMGTVDMLLEDIKGNQHTFSSEHSQLVQFTGHLGYSSPYALVRTRVMGHVLDDRIQGLSAQKSRSTDRTDKEPL